MIIVELFGPSGAGKTTIADALAFRLRQEGYAVRAVIGRRTHLFSRSLTRSFEVIQSWSRGARQTHLVAAVMKLLPPHSLLWSMRLRGYLSHLCDEMSLGSNEDVDITLLDQGFVQAICSLVQLSGIVDRRRITVALACVPKPDLVIRVDAPLKILEARLVDRRQRLGPIQRGLELDLQKSLDQVKLVEMLFELMAAEGPPSVTVSCSDERSLAAAIETIMSEVRLKTRYVSCASSRPPAPSSDLCSGPL